jgi:hypothetical protein
MHTRVRVLLTIDTEVWPNRPGWPHVPLVPGFDCAREIACYFYGGETEPRLGVPYQLETFRRFGLKATYFVDPMFSFALGAAPLHELLALVRSYGQEIGLHLHPEWLTDPRCAGMPKFAGPDLGEYAEPDQRTLVQAALTRLGEFGARPIRAFRAGSWSARRATLRALAANGIEFDSSLNACFEASFPDLPDRDALLQPLPLEGVWEFPVTHFIDRPPAGRRPMHVCASSLAELRAVLEHARTAGWGFVVIVLHGFEFVRVDRLSGRAVVTAQRLLASRFESLCAYLAAHESDYESCHFADLDVSAMRMRRPGAPWRSNRARTALRQLEQLASRVY